MAELGLEALSKDPIGVIDKDHVMRTAREAVSSPSHFCWVSEIDGRVEGAVTALTLDLSFHRGKHLQVVQFYCRPAARGDGVRMLRRMREWADGRPAIRLTTITVEMNSDPRVELLLERLGYRCGQSDMMRFRQ